MEITPREMETKTDKTPAEIEQEAIEGNEIIAAWLGWIRREPDEYNLPNWWEPDPKDGRKKGTFRGYPHQLKFHSSWDWLMPVVVRCHELGDAEEQKFPEAKDLDDPTGWKAWNYRRVGLSTDINQVYTNVVNFIKWYNSQYTSNQPKKQ